MKDRKFRVVTNGCVSDGGNVLLGVPQGTFFTAILFVIMISNINENINDCIFRSFANDTRVNKKIMCNEDKKSVARKFEISIQLGQR